MLLLDMSLSFSSVLLLVYSPGVSLVIFVLFPAVYPPSVLLLVFRGSAEATKTGFPLS